MGKPRRSIVSQVQDQALESCYDRIVDLGNEPSVFKVESYLSELKFHKNLTAIGGIFTPTKLGLGFFFDSIPRFHRAKQAANLRKIFRAARAYTFDVATNEDTKLLREFYNKLRLRDIDSVRKSNFLGEKRINGVITNLSQMALWITVLNQTAPEGLDEESILGKYMPGRNVNNKVKKNMLSGWTHRKIYINSPKKYLADFIIASLRSADLKAEIIVQHTQNDLLPASSNNNSSHNFSSSEDSALEAHSL